MLANPISIYINWAAYDELSDNIELTEELAMRQLNELLRLRRSGVRFDYYVMDAFWYARDGAYRTWRKPHWPNGPDAWLSACLDNNVKPGLWVAGNSTHSHDPIPTWRDSLTADGSSLCMFTGGFMPHFLESLHQWVERGVRMFKFDFMNLSAATPEIERTMLPSEIRAQNIAALHAGLKVFRQQYPEVVLLAYNGLEEPLWFAGSLHSPQSNTTLPFRKTVDKKWLEIFDTLYCGDPRPADVPTMNFWRSKDIYSDHMVRVYELNGFPLPCIDNSGFMIGTTGTCYNRRTAAWQGMLLLGLARGGWANTYYGNLDLLTDELARWFARVQSMYMDLQMYGRFTTFGALPGTGRPYGFAATGRDGALYAVVNPLQQTTHITLPASATDGRVLFHDAGFIPHLDTDGVTLCAEQLALVGTGVYDSTTYDLGVQADVHIPRAITPMSATFNADGKKGLMAAIDAPSAGTLRIVMRQSDPRGGAKRTTGGSPPNGVPLGQLLTITVMQNSVPVPVDIAYDKAIWSGLSWAVVEVPADRLIPGMPVTIRCESQEPAPVALTAEVYTVAYT